MGRQPRIPRRSQARYCRIRREAELWVGVDVVARYRGVRRACGKLVMVQVISQVAAIDGSDRADEPGPLRGTFQRGELCAQHEGRSTACLCRSRVRQQKLAVAAEPVAPTLWLDRAAPGLWVPRDQRILVEDRPERHPDVRLCCHSEEDRDMAGTRRYIPLGIHRVGGRAVSKERDCDGYRVRVQADCIIDDPLSLRPDYGSG